MRIYPAETPVASCLFAHGAGAGEDHRWMVRVATDLATQGITVVTFNFPYMAVGRRAPDRAPVLEEAFADAWIESAAVSPEPRFAGGKSMGGRIATQVTARAGLRPPPWGLVCFGYPLHPAGKPSDRRDKHFAGFTTPILLLSGTRDPLGSPDELRALTDTIPSAELVLFDGGDHSIVAPRRKGAPDLVGQAVHQAAEWMRTVAGGARG